MKEALFETASVVGTVGVTLGVTPFLRGYSHLTDMPDVFRKSRRSDITAVSQRI